MMKRLIFLCWLLVLLPNVASAAPHLEAFFPYRLGGGEKAVAAGSTNPLYVSVAGGFAEAQEVVLAVDLPHGVRPVGALEDGWRTDEAGSGQRLTRVLTLAAGYDNWFDLLNLQTDQAVEGELQLIVAASGRDGASQMSLPFRVQPAQDGAARVPWRIKSVAVPVDYRGERDDRQADQVVYLRDMRLEALRSRITGKGEVDWAALDRHPFAHVAVVIANPAGSQELVRIKAELYDRATGELLPGLGSVARQPLEEQLGADALAQQEEKAARALFGLNGDPEQTLVLPLSGDTGRLPAGPVVLRLTLSGTGAEQIIETPLQLVSRRQGTAAILGGALAALVALAAFLTLRGARLFDQLGARGVITVALFGAVSFGAITVPTTLAGDLLHVLLGPFSALASGLLSGVLLYLFLLALHRLYPLPGVVSLMLLLKWLLAALVFGRLSLVGLGCVAVHAVLLELLLWAGGCSRAARRLPDWGVALACGLLDMAVTYANLEMMIFFYRLYYADWYIALYVLSNGLLYSSLGAWLGGRVGEKLVRVTGE